MPLQGPLTDTEDAKVNKTPISRFLPSGKGDGHKHNQLEHSDDWWALGQSNNGKPLNEGSIFSFKTEISLTEPSRRQIPYKATGFPDPMSPPWPGPQERHEEEPSKDICPEAWATTVIQPASQHRHPRSRFQLVFVTEAQDLTLSSPLLSNMRTPHGPFRSHARKLPLLIAMK